MLVTLNEVLKKSQAERYAVGLFNTINTDMLDAAIEAAEELKSPIIIGTAEVLMPYGELELIAPSILAKARSAAVPVVVHYDHGLTFNRVLEAIKLGFSSVMYDRSDLSEKENAAAVKEIVKIAHSFGVSVEAEIGRIGGAEDASSADDTDENRYTKVSEAVGFVNETGADALAIAVGTVHGVYKKPPKLNFERIAEIRSATGIPLVLHGGSGLSDDDFRKTISAGIAKINIFTDLTLAAKKAMKDGLEADKGYLELRNLQKSAIKQEIIKKIRLFGSAGKA